MELLLCQGLCLAVYTHSSDPQELRIRGSLVKEAGLWAKEYHMIKISTKKKYLEERDCFSWGEGQESREGMLKGCFGR